MFINYVQNKVYVYALQLLVYMSKGSFQLWDKNHELYLKRQLSNEKNWTIYNLWQEWSKAHFYIKFKMSRLENL